MERHGTRIVDLVNGTGVSRDVVNKILGRSSASTSVDSAILIAAFYGKSVNQFVSKQDVSDIEKVTTLFELMQPEDLHMLEAQIQGILAQRARQSGPPRKIEKPSDPQAQD